MNIFRTRILLNWSKCSGLGWPKRKFVNSAYIDFFPQLNLNCSALPGPGWPGRDLSAWAHCEGSYDAFRVAAGTTMVSLTQATSLIAKVKTAACLENYYSCLCWPILRGSGAEIPSLWGHAQPPTLVPPTLVILSSTWEVLLKLTGPQLALGMVGQGKTALGHDIEGLGGFVLLRAGRRARVSTKMCLDPQARGLVVGLGVMCHTLGKGGRTLVHQCLHVMAVKFAVLREKRKSMILHGECVVANHAGAD